MRTDVEAEPQEPEIKLYIECEDCGENIILESNNTIIFQAPDDSFYHYTKCINDCESNVGEIRPDLIHYFNYFEHWYDKDGNKISELQLGGIILGETVEVEYIPTWDEILLAQIQYAEAFEFANDYELKRWAGQ